MTDDDDLEIPSVSADEIRRYQRRQFEAIDDHISEHTEKPHSLLLSDMFPLDVGMRNEDTHHYLRCEHAEGNRSFTVYYHPPTGSNYLLDFDNYNIDRTFKTFREVCFFLTGFFELKLSD